MTQPSRIAALPCDRDAEAIVAGCMILDDRALAHIRAALIPGDFFDIRARAIFGAVCKLADAGQPIELPTLLPLLTRDVAFDLAGGEDYIVNGCMPVPDTSSHAYYTTRVKEMSILRSIIGICDSRRTEALEPNADAVVLAVDMASQLGDLIAGMGGNSVTFSEATQAVLTTARNMVEHDTPPGMLFGIEQVDRVLGGARPGELITLAGGPGSGKTALADTIARNLALAGKTILIVSAEMTSDERGKRLLQGQSGVPGQKIRFAKSLDHSDWDSLYRAQSLLAKTSGFILSRGTIRPRDILAEAKRIKSVAKRLDLIGVDYLQLLTPDDIAKGESTARIIGKMAWQMKALAMDLSVPVIMLSQLNRAGLKGENPPGMHDLKESGDIENHSNAVLLLHHPDETTPQEFGRSVWLKVAKSRDGFTTNWPPYKPSITLAWYPETTTFQG
jgi:replicative DNA helicase